MKDILLAVYRKGVNKAADLLYDSDPQYEENETMSGTAAEKKLKQLMKDTYVKARDRCRETDEDLNAVFEELVDAL